MSPRVLVATSSESNYIKWMRDRDAERGGDYTTIVFERIFRVVIISISRHIFVHHNIIDMPLLLHTKC